MTKEKDKIHNTITKITRHESGKIASKGHYMNGKRHGLATGWRDNGTKQWEMLYRHDKPHGIKIEWRDNGMKHNESVYKGGELHGVVTEWYENGEKAEKMFKEGHAHGLWVWWYENGVKEMEIYHFCGEGYASIKWNKEGNVIDVKFPQPPPIPKIKPKAKPITKLKKSHHQAHKLPYI